VHLLFEHGAFTAADSAATAQALVWLALGLPAHVLVKALSPAFFARNDTMTPLIATLVGLGVAIVAALLLDRAFDTAGIAASIALAAWCSAAVLMLRGRARLGFSLGDAARQRLPRIALAALVMGGALALVTNVISPLAETAHRLTQAVILGLLIAVGLALYGLLMTGLGVVSPREVRAAIRQSRQKI
jgi:putative peptidoglycan lipid II flippase